LQNISEGNTDKNGAMMLVVSVDKTYDQDTTPEIIGWRRASPFKDPPFSLATFFTLLSEFH